MPAICYRHELGLVASTHSKYSGKNCVIELATITFSNSTKMHLDVQHCLMLIDKAVRDCVVGEVLCVSDRPYSDMYDGVCKGVVIEQEEAYLVPLVYTNEVYAEVLLQLVWQEVENRWLEYWLGRPYTCHFKKDGGDLHIYNHNEKIISIHFCTDDIFLQWPKETALTKEEKEAVMQLHEIQKIKLAASGFFISS